MKGYATTIRLAVWLLILLCRAGCGSRAEVAPDGSDDGGQITLSAGQTLAITLASNPTAGYCWAVQSVDAAVLPQVGEPAYEPADTGLAGAGGRLCLRRGGTGSVAARLFVRRIQPPAATGHSRSAAGGWPALL